MRSYLDAYSNGEMNNKMEDIEKFNAKKDNAKNIGLLFKKVINVLSICFLNCILCIKFHYALVSMFVLLIFVKDMHICISM